MSTEIPLWLQNGSYSALADRTQIDTIFTAGVIAPSDLAVTQRAAGANMSVDVAAGSVVIAGTDVSEQGKYLCRSSAVTNVPIATAPGTGNSRISVIYARARDEDAIGGSNNDWIISVVEGTAASSPSVPSIPASSIALAQVLVSANVTSIVNSKITDKRVQALTNSRNPHARMDLASVQIGIDADTWTQITVTSSFASGVLTTGNQLTIVTPGRYRVYADISAPAMVTAGDAAVIGIYVNGSIVKSDRDAADAGQIATPQICTLLDLNAGDTVSLWFNQPVAGGFGAQASTAELSIEFVGGA